MPWILKPCEALGLQRNNSDQITRTVVGKVLQIPGQVLHDSAQMTRLTPIWLNQGKAIANILEAILAPNSLFERLSFLGFKAGLWPQLYFWDPRQSCYREHPFQSVGTRAPPK